MKRMGFLQYKCRRCGIVYDGLHAPDGLIALTCAIKETDHPWPKGFYIDKYEIHLCPDQHSGVADIIGFKYDAD